MVSKTLMLQAQTQAQAQTKPKQVIVVEFNCKEEHIYSLKLLDIAKRLIKEIENLKSIRDEAVDAMQKLDYAGNDVESVFNNIIAELRKVAEVFEQIYGKATVEKCEIVKIEMQTQQQAQQK